MIRALSFDAYGTLLRNDGLITIHQRIVADHRLTAPATEVGRLCAEMYYEAAATAPFRTLRLIEHEVYAAVLRRFECAADAAPYVEQFFEATTKIELYPETLAVLRALAHLPAVILSNADQEHADAWGDIFPVRSIIISETVGAYKPDARMFERAVKELGVAPHEVLHVGDSDFDDVKGAKEAGLRAAWVNRDSRARRTNTPAPDYEIRDLTALLKLL